MSIIVGRQDHYGNFRMVLPQGDEIGKTVNSRKPQIEDHQVYRQPAFKQRTCRIGVCGFVNGDTRVELAKRLYQPFPDQSMVFDN